MRIDEEQILKRRAESLAQKQEKNVPSGAVLTVVEFLLFPEKYALSAHYVREVFTLRDLTPVPGTPAYISGLVNFRGAIISLLNLKVLFGMEERGLTEMNKVLLLRDTNMEFGLIADGIIGSSTILLDEITETPNTFASEDLKYVKGITSNGAIFLDAKQMLSDKSLQVNQ